MQFDVFISYAWGGPENIAHREFVRLLAAHLRQIGFNVGIDAKVDYGEDLTGFMEKIADAKHVLMIVDEGYVERADNHPDSGVGRETAKIQAVIDGKPDSWLSVLFVRNEAGSLPSWMEGRNPKYFDFRYREKDDSFPGAEQIDDLWRWLVGLPADKENAVSPATIRERMYRVERVDNLAEPGLWALPELEGSGVEFRYGEAPSGIFALGFDGYAFSLKVSSRGEGSVYVYRDHIKAVGLIPESISFENLNAKIAASYIRSCRHVSADVGRTVVLLNALGCVCVVKITSTGEESHEEEYVPAQIVFDYRIFAEEDGV